MIEVFVLQFPGKRMRDEDRAESRLQRRIDIRPRTVADHKGARRIQLGLRNQQSIVRRSLFDRYPDSIEQWPQPGSIELAQLLARVALGEQQEPMAPRKFT